MNNLLLGFVCCLLLCAPAAAQTNQSPAAAPRTQGVVASAPPAGSKPDAAQLRRQSFDIVWRTINEAHFDPTFGGLDWKGVRERYAPRAAAAKSDEELYGVLRAMLRELHSSHFAIYPPGAFASAGSVGGTDDSDDDGGEDDAGGGDGAGAENNAGKTDDAEETNARSAKRGQLGIDVRVVENQVVVTRVAPQSVAWRGGLRRGFVIKKIDDASVEEITGWITRSALPPSYKQTYATAAILRRVNGKPGAGVRLTFLDESDRTREATFTLEPSADEMSEAFGSFPALPTQFDARRLDGDIGYIRFNVWVASLMPKIRAAVKGMANAPGLIIDLRGNPGGLGIMSTGLGGLLSAKPITLGTMTQRAGYFNFITNPQPNAYTGALVILTDNLSASTSEIFALGMQEAKRAVVVGERTAGAALPSIFSKLPTGATFQYAVADFRTPKNVRIENRGVIPDVEVKLARRALLADGDNQLDAAVQHVNKTLRGGRKEP